MKRDFKRMTGIDAERSDFESETRTHKKPVCPKCGKRFGAHIAVRDHMRDKHKVQTVTAVGAA